MIFRQYEERLARLRKKESTIRNHRRTAVLFRESGLDPLTAEDWQIEEWLAGLQVTTPHQRDSQGQPSAPGTGLSPRTVRLHYENLCAVYRYAVHRRLLPVSPMETVALASEPDKEPKILANAELRRLLGAAIGDQQWLMLHLLMYTGMRRSELRLLRWDAIQPTSIRVIGKGDKLRHVPVHPRLAEVLFEQEPQSAFVMHGSHADRPLSDTGLHYRLQKLTPVVDCSFHDFRRTVATSLAENAVQNSIIDRIMGWAPRTVGQRYYIRRADASMQEAILALYADDPLFEVAA